jgi:hypothetical protein
MALARYVLVAVVVVLGCSGGAQAQVPKSLSELPKDQYVIEGLAGVKIVAWPKTVECADDPKVIVGVRFTRAAKRVRYAQALSLGAGGRTLSKSRRFRNSSRWQFGTLRLTGGCGVLHEVQYSFHRRGDQGGQRLGEHLCVLRADGGRCPIPDEGE